MENFLVLVNVCKSYIGDDGVIINANDNVNFTLKRGEIHALLGENGAGKSTIVRNLSRKPDSGKIFLDGIETIIENPLDAMQVGIGISHQELSKSLVERHNVAENIISVVEGKLFSIGRIKEKIKDSIDKYDLDPIDPDAKIWKLSGGEKQRVEILKAIITDPKILVLDEPTSMLTPVEVTKLFHLIQTLKKNGKSVIIITHHLEEAIEFSDRITVMRQGKVVDVFDEAQVDAFRLNMQKGIQTLANSMIGRELLYDLNKTTQSSNIKDPLLSIESLVVSNDMGYDVVRKVDLQLKDHHILGLAGIAGNGQKELIEALLNLRESKSGVIKIRDRISNNLSIRQVRDLGVSYIPEIRNKGMIPDLSIRLNLILNSYFESSNGFIDHKMLLQRTDQLIKDYDIKTSSPSAPLSSLSGGNKQKVVVARELSKEYSLGNLIIIAENPTIGLDVRTTQFVRQQLLKKRDNGAGILLISSDLTEILSLCDEIAVIYKGEIFGVVKAELATRESIGLMMGGVKSTHEVLPEVS